jgi:two-component system sensor histidine kinase DegS
MSNAADPPPDSAAELAARIAGDLTAIDRELAEIEMLVGQTRAEANRHEQKRGLLADRLAAADATQAPKEVVESWTQLVTQTRRAAVMEAQVDVLEGKRRALIRHREALAGVAAALETLPATSQASPGDEDSDGPGQPSLSRVVMNAQEDLRRDIARAMHDGPAQSLTNIVLQVAIVERLMERDPESAKGELRLLVSMVQQTLDATKNFIFDVRPMVLDDLGVMPTLRRMARDRGRRARIPVEFDSLGHDRRLPMEMESTIFRILDETLAAYLSMSPDRVRLRLDWTEELEARLIAERTPVLPTDEPLPDVPTVDVPDALRQMMQERHDARDAAIAAARAAAVLDLPASTRRDVSARATSIGGRIEMLAGGGEMRLLVPLPSESGPAGDEADRNAAGAR